MLGRPMGGGALSNAAKNNVESGSRSGFRAPATVRPGQSRATSR
jgi:hypothetical protein